jgi:hypothetical protein
VLLCTANLIDEAEPVIFKGVPEVGSAVMISSAVRLVSTGAGSLFRAGVAGGFELSIPA